MIVDKKKRQYVQFLLSLLTRVIEVAQENALTLRQKPDDFPSKESLLNYQRGYVDGLKAAKQVVEDSLT